MIWAAGGRGLGMEGMAFYAMGVSCGKGRTKGDLEEED